MQEPFTFSLRTPKASFSRQALSHHLTEVLERLVRVRKGFICLVGCLLIMECLIGWRFDFNVALLASIAISAVCLTAGLFWSDYLTFASTLQMLDKHFSPQLPDRPIGLKYLLFNLQLLPAAILPIVAWLILATVFGFLSTAGLWVPACFLHGMAFTDTTDGQALPIWVWPFAVALVVGLPVVLISWSTLQKRRALVLLMRSLKAKGSSWEGSTLLFPFTETALSTTFWEKGKFSQWHWANVTHWPTIQKIMMSRRYTLLTSLLAFVTLQLALGLTQLSSPLFRFLALEIIVNSCTIGIFYGGLLQLSLEAGKIHKALLEFSESQGLLSAL